MACIFHKLQICFFLSVLKKNNKHNAHMCGGIKTLSTKAWGTLCDWLTTAIKVSHICAKNLTNTSKTRQVKHTQMVATARFTIRVFGTFSDCKESNASKLSRERVWV